MVVFTYLHIEACFNIKQNESKERNEPLSVYCVDLFIVNNISDVVVKVSVKC